LFGHGIHTIHECIITRTRGGTRTGDLTLVHKTPANGIIARITTPFLCAILRAIDSTDTGITKVRSHAHCARLTIHRFVVNTYATAAIRGTHDFTRCRVTATSGWVTSLKGTDLTFTAFFVLVAWGHKVLAHIDRITIDLFSIHHPDRETPTAIIVHALGIRMCVTLGDRTRLHETLNRV